MPVRIFVSSKKKISWSDSLVHYRTPNVDLAHKSQKRLFARALCVNTVGSYLRMAIRSGRSNATIIPKVAAISAVVKRSAMKSISTTNPRIAINKPKPADNHPVRRSALITT